MNNQDKSQNQFTQDYEEYLKNNFIREFNKSYDTALENNINIFKSLIEDYLNRGI